MITQNRILVIDDDPSWQELLAESIEAAAPAGTRVLDLFSPANEVDRPDRRLADFLNRLLEGHGVKGSADLYVARGQALQADGYAPLLGMLISSQDKA